VRTCSAARERRAACGAAVEVPAAASAASGAWYRVARASS
jgi:hypothetical protein